MTADPAPPIPDELRRYLHGSLDSGAMVIRVHRNDVQLVLQMAQESKDTAR